MSELTISALIRLLEGIKTREGDIPVACLSPAQTGFNPSRVRVHDAHDEGAERPFAMGRWSDVWPGKYQKWIDTRLVVIS